MSRGMQRTQLYADPTNLFLHDLIFESCRRHPHKTAIVDISCGRRFSYAEYGDVVESLARGLVSAGLKPGEVVAIFLANSWEFCASYHAATLAGAIPTLLNPTYREREVRYQLENSGAVLLNQRRVQHQWRESQWTSGSPPSLQHTAMLTRHGAFYQPAQADFRSSASARGGFQTHSCCTSLLQRYHRIA
jgi:acyl-CoA synthetase (AMP-forming)/AMP-acid ligase II